MPVRRATTLFSLRVYVARQNEFYHGVIGGAREADSDATFDRSGLTVVIEFTK
jgi:hypothetical protein